MQQPQYTLDVYRSPQRTNDATGQLTFTKPGFHRGFAVRSLPGAKAIISEEEADHEPFPMTALNRGAARPIAPIECVPSPQAFFGMK